MTLFLGVDGGGTKTAFVLLDDRGDIRAALRLSSTYHFTSGIAHVEAVLSDGVITICRQAGIEPFQIGRAFFGLPGYGESSADEKRLDVLPQKILGHSRYSCGNDMVCGWAGSLGGMDGINVIGGTGSMAYGERGGRGRRVGGWGELFSDEGSGYWIAIRGLNAFTCMSDGRIPRGPLYEALRVRIGVDNDLDLIGVVFNDWRSDRSAIAELSKTVVEAASAGDQVAAAILTEACSELAGLVETTRVSLDFGPNDNVPVSHSGGIFDVAAIRNGFRQALMARHPTYDLRPPLLPPWVGAALYAAKQNDTPLSEAAVARLRSTSWSEDRSAPFPVHQGRAIK